MRAWICDYAKWLVASVTDSEMEGDRGISVPSERRWQEGVWVHVPLRSVRRSALCARGLAGSGIALVS